MYNHNLFDDHDYEKISIEDYNNLSENVVLDKFSLEEITVNEVPNKLKEIDISKSSGPDEIHPKILYELRSILCVFLCVIFNVALIFSKVPLDWMLSIVSALYKRGLKEDICNYRPISLTCIVCKIFESLTYDKLMSYALSNKLLSEKQFGFLRADQQNYN